jgi:hypothetical protein
MIYEPLVVLPEDIQWDWQAELILAEPAAGGVFRLVAARRAPSGYEAQRITVLVIDENGFPMPGIPVAFSYSTAEPYPLSNDYLWRPPTPRRALIVPTHGDGEIDQIQGSPVRDDQPGGVTVYVLTKIYSSDVVTGCGMLADHTGLHLTFQLRRPGVQPLAEWQQMVERRLASLEGK